MGIEDTLDRVSSAQLETREFVLSLAKEFDLDLGRVLPYGVLEERSNLLKPKHRNALGPTMKALISDGIVKVRKGCILLTDKGKEYCLKRN